MATQGEAVFQAVSAVFDSETVPPTTQWSDSQKEQVNSLVLNSFLTGFTTHSNSAITTAELKKYIPGLVNNWVRKDKRLNGGVTYQAKRPGSRSGSGDEQVKAMRALLAVTSDPESKQAIQSELDKRLAALKPTVSIDAAALPESLRHLVK